METTCTSRHRRKTALHRRSKNKYDKTELSACISNQDVTFGKPRTNGEDNINDNATDVLGEAEYTLYQGVLYSQNVTRFQETPVIVM
jgi:hypothetical protein